VDLAVFYDKYTGRKTHSTAAESGRGAKDSTTQWREYFAIFQTKQLPKRLALLG